MAGALADYVKDCEQLIIVDPGGFTLPFVAAQAQRLSRSGKKVAVFTSSTLYNQDLLLQTADLANFEVELFAISRSTGTKVLNSIINYFKLVMAVYRRARREKSCVALNFGVIALLDALLLLTVPKSRRIFICHNPIEHGRQKPEFGHWLRGLLAGKIVVLSKFSWRLFRKFYPKQWRSKLCRIDHGEIYALASSSMQLPEFRPPSDRLIFFGNIKPYKDANFILDLAIALPKYKIEVYGKGAAKLVKDPEQLMSLSNLSLNDAFLSDRKLDQLLRSDGIFVLSHDRATQSGVLWLLKTYRCNFILTRVPGLVQDIPPGLVKYISFARRSIPDVEKALACYQNDYREIHRQFTSQ